MELRKRTARWWNRVTGIPARLLMHAMARREPWREHDRIRVMVADAWLTAHTERFFERTSEALARAAADAPGAYAELREDVRQVLLWGQGGVSSYNRFQLAIVVPPSIALEADAVCYSAWLLHASALLLGPEEAQARAEELLRSLEPDERAWVGGWLTSVTERGPPVSRCALVVRFERTTFTEGGWHA
jgi:hypothetical protein